MMLQIYKNPEIYGIKLNQLAVTRLDLEWSFRELAVDAVYRLGIC